MIMQITPSNYNDLKLFLHFTAKHQMTDRKQTVFTSRCHTTRNTASYTRSMKITITFTEPDTPPTNSKDLNSADYAVCGTLQENCIMVDSLPLSVS